MIGDHSTIQEIVGIDGIQALQLALFMVGSSLRSMSHASDWRWAGEAGSGFPSTLKEPLFGERNVSPPFRTLSIPSLRGGAWYSPLRSARASFGRVR